MCRFDPHNYMQEATTGIRFPITFDKQYLSTHTTYIASLRVVDDDIIHSRFAHASERRLNQLATRCVGFPKPTNARVSLEPTSCDACNAGGARRLPFHPHPNPTKYSYFGARLS